MVLLFLFSSCQGGEASALASRPKFSAPLSSNTFVAGLPVPPEQILWFCDYEDRSFSKWEGKGQNDANAGGGIFITDETNTEYGIESSIVHSGNYSAYATIKNARFPTLPKAIRFMRWTDKPWYEDGDYFPEAAYYSTFFYMKDTYDPQKDPDNDPEGDGGWWNIFQFKSNNNAGSQPLVVLDLYNKDGKMYLGLVIKDYPDDHSSHYQFRYILSDSPVPVEPAKWNHIEVYYKKSKNYDGEVIVWQNSIQIFEQKDIRTVLPQDETAKWGIGNYTDYVTGGAIPGTATIYLDDSIVSSVRISQYLFRERIFLPLLRR